ncbi:hypothetical protein L3X38_015878 [Prunus dulcis]|uniref:Uncharacterized protein n=1 Tax=Prunus dulcis TaxID=3755 RepID=A0AAD4Z899_PRUDU|nr:hypothetical protein L3X38_015878 [Prunus dulcis]
MRTNMKQPYYQRAWNILKPNKHQPKKKRKLKPNEAVSLVAELVGCFQREVLPPTTDKTKNKQRRPRPHGSPSLHANVEVSDITRHRDKSAVSNY